MAEHYNVGVYGLWYGNNYGSIITYYALSKVMEELGFTYAMIRNPLGREIDIDSLERSHPLKFAREKYQITKLRPLSRLHELNEFFDGFLIGSDQMWNYHLSKPYQQSYFLDFAADDKIKMAYATSFGKSTYIGPPEEKKVTRENLKRFDAISVRDDFSKRICEEDFNVPAEIVLDPVFLCPVEKYEELIAEADDFKIDEEYIFAYILDPNPQIGASIQKIAQDSGKKVIVVFNQSGDKEKLRSALQITDERVAYILDPTVKEWLYLYRNSVFVVTDSFHGSCFSIIFRKPFIVMKNNGRGGGRFPFLLGSFGLLDRMVESPEAIYEKFRQIGLDNRIDYEKVYGIISKKREESLKWLKNALNGKSNKVAVSSGTNGINTEKDKAVVNTLDMRSCTGCGACENICPVDAIAMTENKEGFLNPVLNNEKCVNCGLCSKKCIALNPEYKNVSEPKCFAMMADDDTRFISSSGGMFTVAAEYVLDKGGYVCGAAYTDNFEVEHIIISDKSQLSLLRGSKYMQSHTRHIYKDVKSLLEGGKLVLFTGMPCQVAGLYSFLGKDYDNLYTIDLLCHGITSSKVFEKYHKDVLDGKPLSRLEFKAKEPWGWHAGVNAYFTDGTRYSKPLESDAYFIAYLKSIAKNTTCGTCGVNRLPRQGDLTIGDFWGIAKNDPEMFDNKGTSVVLVNNEKARRFFDELKPKMQACKEESLANAIMGNRIISHPYKLHKNRELFFENFDKLDFSSLTMGCYNNQLYDKLHNELVKKMAEDEIEFYYLAKAAAEKSNGRQIVTWMHSEKFESVLQKEFGLNVSFHLTRRPEVANANTLRHVSVLKGAVNKYYLVGLDAEYNAESADMLTQYGYKEIDDFIFRKHKPVVLTKYDCSKGSYSDVYGNTVEGYGNIIGRIVFRGVNNHIVVGKETDGINLEFDLTSNVTVHIGSGCHFNARNVIQTRNYNGFSDLHIMDGCRFTNTLFRMFNSPFVTSISIDQMCTFETDISFHANAGKKIIIGKDCMFSHDIDLWAGDGHSIFDVKTGKNINTDYPNLPEHRNRITIGSHVWVAKGAFIMHGTNIGNGSIVGAKSVVKGRYPNNCSIAGNPSSIIKTDVAWSREMLATDMMRQCGGEEYVKLTEHSELPPADKHQPENRKPIENEKIKNWFVTGGSTGLGRELVLRLHSMGYKVVATCRTISKLDDLPSDIVKLQLDVKDIESCKQAVQTAIAKLGRIDVLVNNAGVSHISTFEETPENVAKNIIETNFWGTANMIKAVLPHMHKNRNGTVINISSSSGFRPRNYGSYYVASKFAVDNLTKNLKFECQRFMRFMAVDIGGLNTGMADRQDFIPTNIDEYRNISQPYPFPEKYINDISKTVDAIIKVTGFEELPRNLVLGWDAYSQFPQVMKDIKDEAEQYRNISVTTDAVNYIPEKIAEITQPRNHNLNIQNWLITGGSGGFGKVLALRLQKLGYKVAVTSRDIRRLDSFPDDIVKIESSLSSFNECRKVIEAAVEKMGSVDVLVNNATTNCWCSYEECPYDIMKSVFDVNYTIPQNMIKAVLPHMREKKNGTVINVTSIAGIQPRAKVTVYSAAKAALEGLTRTLKTECGAFARFMAIEPGYMRTGIKEHNPVIETKMDDYHGLDKYAQDISNTPNSKNITVQQLINVVNQEELPRCMLVGTESYLIALDEVERSMAELEKYKDISLSVCDELPKI